MTVRMPFLSALEPLTILIFYHKILIERKILIMGYTVAITKSGQMTLPKSLREFLGVDGAKRITLDKRKNEVVIKRKMSKEEYYKKIEKNISPETRKILDKESAAGGHPPIRDIMEEIATSAELQAGWKGKYGQ